MNEELLKKAEKYAESICQQVPGLRFQNRSNFVFLSCPGVGRIAEIAERKKYGYRPTGILYISVGPPCGRKKIYPETKSGAGLDRQNVIDEIKRIVQSCKKGEEARAKDHAEWEAVYLFLSKKFESKFGGYLDVGRFKNVRVEGTNHSRIKITLRVELCDYDAVIAMLEQEE